MPYKHKCAYANTDEVLATTGEGRRTMPRWLVLVMTTLSLLPILMVPMAAGSAQTTDAKECDPSGTFVAVSPGDRDLKPIMGDPYDDGKITWNEQQWMRQYEEATGDTYNQGDYTRYRAVMDCIEGRAPVHSVDPASAQIDESDDRLCRTTARDWTKDFGMGSEAIAVLSGCRQDRQGSWFFPTGPDDPRLPAPILTPEEERQTAALRAEIQAQLAGIEATMPFWLPEELDRLYAPNARPISGHRNPNLDFAMLRSQYEEALIVYLRNPNHLALFDYVAWWFNRREAAVPAATCATMPAPICDVMRKNLGHVGGAPWPWDLEDPLTLAEYLDWALANGLVLIQPTPVPTPPPSSSGGIGSSPTYPLSIHIVEASGAPLNGACVEVVLPLGTGTVCDNDQLDESPVAGLIEVRGSPWTYSVQETQPPSGYKLVEGVRIVELTSAGASIVLVHEAVPSDPGPTEIPSLATPTAETAAGFVGQTYTSPQFGYVVTWLSPWEVDAATSDPRTGDRLRLVTGEVAMEYHGFSTDQSVEQTLEDFVAARALSHPGATPQYQAPGGGLNSDSAALWHFTYKRADGVEMSETTTARLVASGGAIMTLTVIRPTADTSPRSLYYAVSFFLDPIEATATAQ